MNYLRSASASSWVVVVLLCLAILVFGYFYRSQGDVAASNSPVAETNSKYLPRTNKMARQKQRSLETYNDEIPLDELLDFYRKHTRQMVSAEAYGELDRLMLSQVVDKIWSDASQQSADHSTIVHQVMYEAIQQFYPHQTLTNADVILFPDDSKLRIIISEPGSDFFRDTARHWRWIADFAEQVGEEQGMQLKEIDAYAAEELSEFLSVLAVGIVELAAEKSADNVIEPNEIATVFERISQHAPDVVIPRDSKLRFSEATKQELANSLPKQLFEDITRQTGIDFLHQPNDKHWDLRHRLAIPLGIAGGGVSAGDFDGDDLIDLYFAGDNGGALFRNEGRKKFANVSQESGIPSTGESRAGYFVDYDNDGDLDLFITFVGAPNRLLQNDGTGSFQDVSDQIGLTKDNFISHEAVWFDMDNDGLLELYVANFGDWLAGESPTLGRINSNAPPNRLYKHELVDGKHRLVEIGEKLNVDDRGWTHCVGAYDLDQDGWTDLFSINDFGASVVYRNLEGRGFEEVSRQFHLDDIYNGMSFTLLDLDYNSRFSIYISQIMKLTHRQRYSRPTEATKVQFDPTKQDNLRVLITNRLFSRAFESSFRDDHNYRIEPTKLGWSWDVSGLDYENDSDIDLLVLNGTESAIPSKSKSKTRDYVLGRNFLAKFNFEQNVFFIQENGYFYDWSENNPVAFLGNSRGSAFLDLDDDGDLDIVVSNYNHAPRVFENLQNSGNNWIRIQLEGTKSNRNAIGAVVEVRFDGKSRFGTVVSGSGFLSQNPYLLHFGLGQSTAVEKIVVRWPTGVTQEMEDLQINKSHVIREE